MAPASPTLAAWELGQRLKEARENLGLTGSDAAKALGITQNYMSNIEHGRRTIAEDKLRQLTAVYELPPEDQEELVALRKTCEGRGWWARYGGIYPAELLRFFGYEHGAEEVRSYENILVSGLLQTESYARAIHRGDGANLRMSEVERRVEVRMRRKHRIQGADPLRASILMGEAALRQQVGGTAVLEEQLRHLLDLIDKYPDNLDLRVIPFTAGSYGAMGSSTFHVLTFPSPRLPRLAWLETAVAMDLIDDQARVAQYSASFEEASTFALGRQDTVDLIRDTLKS
ncbi:helix-turn-helix domain-containing protein [Saccharopolyspora phatthalungensis]|uniref:Transcriptional regulator with XRE-family HTH domain n=1 Tax=Saccharopolyspora phatthalungensis TaxID=664693 RepID=A0A840Q1Q5_9PSEU|nr:helix-turn-helix transcriptional regulator [Saccharopolyspora phatthalungensis]MBB5154324.1 transcriptional regulator with XRE-family HTH domain [Saccharopolyspora phatthalungensis]